MERIYWEARKREQQIGMKKPKLRIGKIRGRGKEK